MDVKISEIITKVYALLDENETIIEERVEYGDPGTMLRDLIIDLLPEAARVVICGSPLSKIDECTHLSDVPTDGDGITGATLPADFLRLVNIRMSDWKTGVTVPLDFGGADYQLRNSSTVSGMRRRHPAVAIKYCGERRKLEIFGTVENSIIKELDYVALPEIKGNHINLPSGLVHDICVKIAEMVEAILK